MSMFDDENIINFLSNEKYNLSGYICILQYIQMTNNSNLSLISLSCDYADELLELVRFVERCFPSLCILTAEDKKFLERMVNYKKIIMLNDELKKLNKTLENGKV